MLTDVEIDQVVKDAAASVLKGLDVSRAYHSETTDPVGDNALSVYVVMPLDAIGALSGDLSLDAIVGIQDSLRLRGETRLPIVSFRTEEELQADAGA